MNAADRRTTLAQYFDHTLLKPQATLEQIVNVCSEAREHRFFSVCINPSFLPMAQKELEGSGVALCTVVGFPLGTMTTEAKVTETLDALRKGAQEIDMVLHIGMLLAGNYQYVLDDIVSINEATVQGDGLLKVIIETAMLDEKDKIAACKIVSDAGAAFIKTSTGFGGGGATVEDIRLMREHCAPAVKIKASGGIRDLATAEALIAAGADRLGASAGVNILNELGE